MYERPGSEFVAGFVGLLLVGVLAEYERFALAWGACAAFALRAACTVLAVREAAVSRRAGRAGTVARVFNALLRLDAR